MKKFFFSLGVIAASAFVFSACQKEQSIKDEPSDKLVTVTFTAEKAGVETRTAAVVGETSVSYVWTDEDLANIKLFDVTEGTDSNNNTIEVLTEVSNPTITKDSDTHLTISANVAPGNHVFRAVLSGTWTNNGDKPRVNPSQNPKADNFDPGADILVSDDLEVELVDSGEETVSTGEREMIFRRQVVVNKMMLKNLTAGETINKVVITSDKNLTAYFSYNPTSATGNGKIITLNYNNAITVPANGQVPVYFTTSPGAEHSLTVEVTTNQKVYTKSFAQGKTIDFNKGQFTSFGVVLPEGVTKTSLSLPVVDDMEWANNEGSDATAQLTISDLVFTQDGKKVYSDIQYAYKGADGLKLGKSNAIGSITTSDIDLSSLYNIAVSAHTYGSDASQVQFLVDNQVVYTSGDLTSDFETYYYNATAVATDASKVTIKITGGRGYIKDLEIKTGSYVAPPKIVVTSNNPMEVPNGNDLYAIEYTISNPVAGTSISAEANVAWIHDFDYSVAGEISFEVDAQEAGVAARDGIITLSYAGAKNVEVTVSQAAGEGGETTNTYVFTSASWNATLNGETADWTNNKSGSGTEARGVKVEKAQSGAGATSPISFNSISNISMTLSKSSKGVGKVEIYVGTTKVGTQSSFTTTATPYSFDVSNLSGNVSFVVTCTTSTIYVKDISITSGASAPAPTTYAVNIATDIQNGTVTATPSSEITEGTSVTLSITPDSNYELESLLVDNTDVTSSVTNDGKYTFNMPAHDVAVSATFTEQGEPPVENVVYLTNAEIVAAISALSNTTDSYGNFNISSTTGTWSVNANRNNSIEYLQLRNKSGAKAASPVFSSTISKVVVTMNSTKQTVSRTIHLIPSNTEVPTSSDAYTSTLWANEYGHVATGTSGGDVTINVTGAPTSFILVVEGGATYIDAIAIHLN